jgi:hypothetical protein
LRHALTRNRVVASPFGLCRYFRSDSARCSARHAASHSGEHATGP